MYRERERERERDMRLHSRESDGTTQLTLYFQIELSRASFGGSAASSGFRTRAVLKREFRDVASEDVVFDDHDHTSNNDSSVAPY